MVDFCYHSQVVMVTVAIWFFFDYVAFQLNNLFFLSTHGHKLTWSQFVWLMLIGEIILILKEKKY